MLRLTPALTSRTRFLPNAWDAVAFLLLLGTLAVLVHGGNETLAPLTSIERAPISLDPVNLPEYALRTTLRMLTALAASLFFTFTYATLAAKNRHAGLILVPLLDVLQSVPVLGFLSFTVVGFMALFPGKVAGVELAAVFAIFTSQAWNMAFSFYQSLSTVPRELEEAVRGFRLTGWQRFWKLEVPFAVPGLVWNTMMSMSGGWFFVVASEAIAVGSTTITLPGVGSYLAIAIEQSNLRAVGWAIATMLGVILIYDQILFRPLVAWADKFRVELSVGVPPPESWLLDFGKRTQLVRRLLSPLSNSVLRLARAPLRFPVARLPSQVPLPSSAWGDRIWFAVLGLLAAWTLWHAGVLVHSRFTVVEVLTVLGLGAITWLRVAVLIALCSVVWVPIGVWIGLRPKWAERIQPIAQFLAAFPANIAFPVVVAVIVRFGLSPNIWLSPLMVLGTQWYILFNVIAGASAFPNDLREAATSLHLRGWQWWRKVILPGIFPYYVTGALTASGGSWNASIVAEVASWGTTTLTATGLGAYIAAATQEGNQARVLLGVAVMSIYVIAFNRILWRPVYNYASRHMRA